MTTPGPFFLNLFYYAGLQYFFSLDTFGLTAGTYTLYFTAGNDPVLHAVTFTVI